MHIHHLASRLQNASRARLAATPLPETRLTLQLGQLLLRHGFISSIRRGTAHAPDATPTPTTSHNVALRRYWFGLKYRHADDGSVAGVIQRIRCVSRPSRSVDVTAAEMRALVRGDEVRSWGVEGVRAGEVMVVAVPGAGVVDVWDAVRRGVGGRILCRVS